MSEAALEMQIEDRDGIRVIHLAGPLDSATYDRFKKFLDPMVRQPHARIVLDCRNLTYVNSRGLSLLMHFQQVSKLEIAFFGVAALGPRILKNIELLGLDKAMKWYPTLEQALQTAAVS